MDALLDFLLRYSTLFFLVAFAAMFAGMAVKSLRARRLVALVSFCASAPLFVLYVIASAYRPDVLAIALAALWGWNAGSSLRRWRDLRPATRPARTHNRRN
jgi:hypothetical protein